MKKELISKVLVLDEDQEQAQLIKNFCDENNLVALKVSKNNLMHVLRTNIDLGAILYSENYGDSAEENEAIALKIHSIRSELPIILRRNTEATLENLPEKLKHVFCAVYTTSDVCILEKIIKEYIFSCMYPNALVRGITEITESILSKQFQRMAISWDTPYLVHDRLIFGELFSLIQLESPWCRGYMMIQAEEEESFIEILDSLLETKNNFRTVNSVLGEITNLIWGAFKHRYVGDKTKPSSYQVQLPLIINHKHRYISFGDEDPQLCFCCTLSDEKTGCQIKFHLRFIFNINWAPEDFEELTPNIDGLVETGELELF